MREPNGLELLATLISLFAEQNGVTITYETEGRREERKKTHR